MIVCFPLQMSKAPPLAGEAEVVEDRRGVDCILSEVYDFSVFHLPMNKAPPLAGEAEVVARPEGSGLSF